MQGILFYGSSFKDLYNDYITLYQYKLLRLYSGCQKNVPVFKRFFLQPLMPHFCISEHYYGKRYNRLNVVFYI
jgi:hypothetical protein